MEIENMPQCRIGFTNLDSIGRIGHELSSNGGGCHGPCKTGPGSRRGRCSVSTYDPADALGLASPPLLLRSGIWKQPLEETIEGANRQLGKGQHRLSYHNQEPELCQALGPGLDVAPGADLGLGDVAIRPAITKEHNDDCCNVKDESQPKLHW